MLEACYAIARFTSAMDIVSFAENEIVLSASLRQLELIGEAARNLDPALTARYPGVPWRKLVGLRNILIHEYFDVAHDKVWEVVVRDVPILREQLEQILKQEFPS